MPAFRAVQTTASAAPKTVYANAPASVYDPTSDRTFICYLGLDRDLYVTYWERFVVAAAANAHRHRLIR